MLIKLPVLKDKVICKINFKLDKIGNKVFIKPMVNNFCNYEIFISNLDFCLTKISLDFPLEIEILDNNFLYSKFYFLIAFMDKFDCELDFFSLLIKKIHSIVYY